MRTTHAPVDQHTGHAISNGEIKNGERRKKAKRRVGFTLLTRAVSYDETQLRGSIKGGTGTAANALCDGAKSGGTQP